MATAILLFFSNSPWSKIYVADKTGKAPHKRVIPSNLLSPLLSSASKFSLTIKLESIELHLYLFQDIMEIQ